jgi:hypothetical protein
MSRMNLETTTRVLGWLLPRKDTLKQFTRRDVARMIQSDIGVRVSVDHLGTMEESLGITRARGNAGGGRKDRSVILAQELIRVQEALGMVIHDHVRDIADGK